MDLFNRGATTWQVEQVAEWRAQRCNLVSGTTPALFLARAFSPEGFEVARFALDDKGGLVTFIFPHKKGFELADGHRVVPLLETAATVENLLGTGVISEAQYVAVASPTLSCPETAPCVAVRREGDVFLVRNGQIYELLHQTTTFSNRSFMLDESQRGRIVALASSDDHFVSLGGDLMTIARPRWR